MDGLGWIQVGRANAAGDSEGTGDIAELCAADRDKGAHEFVS